MSGAGETVRMGKPVACQIVAQRRQEVDAEYVLSDAHDVRFKVGPHDLDIALGGPSNEIQFTVG